MIDLFVSIDITHDENILIIYLNQIETDSILVNYDVFKNKLNRIPHREDVKQLYAYVLKAKSVDMQRNINRLSNQFHWTTDQLIFMLLVFIELEFLLSDNSSLTNNPDSEKKELKEAKHYQ